MKVIFLDIDGVLVTHDSLVAWDRIFDRKEASPSLEDLRRQRHRMFAKDPVEQLNRITDETGALICVSSSWRHLKDHAKNLKDAGVTGEIVGRTPDLDQRTGSGLYVAKTRGDEITAWLAEHPSVANFVILDDDGDMGPLLPHLVQTNFESGLTPELADIAIKHLKGELP